MMKRLVARACRRRLAASAFPARRVVIRTSSTLPPIRYEPPKTHKPIDMPPLQNHVDAIDHHISLLSNEFGSPSISAECWVAPSATLVGAVSLRSASSVWYGSVITAFHTYVRIGTETNIQDNCVISDVEGPLDVTHDGSTIIGTSVSVGHNCIIRGAIIEDNCLVGMGSVLEPGSHMGKGSWLAAGSLLETGQSVPAGELWAGKPAKFVRHVDDEEADWCAHLSVIYNHQALLHKETDWSEPYAVGELRQEVERLLATEPTVTTGLGESVRRIYEEDINDILVHHGEKSGF